MEDSLRTLKPARAALLSQSLSHLYSIATCADGCRGGDHVLEALVGRCFNHSLGSLRLIADHLYDESLNLTRSVAEATNLLFLFNQDPSAFETWKAVDAKKRLDKFRPSAVRRALEAGGGVMAISKEAYGELCEVATHVTPQTRPNNHDRTSDIVGHLGGAFQTAGHSVAADKLTLYCSLSSVVACNMFGHPDRVEELGRLGNGAFDA